MPDELIIDALLSGPESSKYDALIVRINPGQLSQGTPEGTQSMFDDLMNKYISEGKLVWSSPKIQTQMGAKDALVQQSVNVLVAHVYLFIETPHLSVASRL